MLNSMPEITFPCLTHDIRLFQVTTRRRVNSDMVMITWTPLTVRPTGKCLPRLGVLAPPSVPCHTGKKKAFRLSSLSHFGSTAGNLKQ